MLGQRGKPGCCYCYKAVSLPESSSTSRLVLTQMHRLKILASQAQKGLWSHEVPESPLESYRLIQTAVYRLMTLTTAETCREHSSSQPLPST